MQMTHGSMVAVAASLLLCNYPFQVAVAPHIIWDLADASLERLPEAAILRAELAGRYDEYTDLDKESQYRLFPAKKGPAAVKTNLWFTDVWADLRREHPTLASVLQRYGPWMAGLSNDQAVCVILYGLAIAHHTTSVPVGS